MAEQKATGGKATTKTPPAAEAKAALAVEAFLEKHLRNSDFSRDTAAWNHFQAGIPVLIGCIAEVMEG